MARLRHIILTEADHGKTAVGTMSKKTFGGVLRVSKNGGMVPAHTPSDC